MRGHGHGNTNQKSLTRWESLDVEISSKTLEFTNFLGGLCADGKALFSAFFFLLYLLLLVRGGIFWTFVHSYRCPGRGLTGGDTGGEGLVTDLH